MDPIYHDVEDLIVAQDVADDRVLDELVGSGMIPSDVMMDALISVADVDAVLGYLGILKTERADGTPDFFLLDGTEYELRLG